MTWSMQQEAALKDVREWLRDKRGPQVFYLAGYAGSGKTTLARSLADDVRGPVCFAAFTGKAAHVMRQRGCADARTIHSLIYRAEDDPGSWEPRFVLNRDSEAAYAKLIVIDEASMVNEELGRDLLSFGTPILVLGDPAQLPPVKGAGFFTNAEPDVMLTEIHRQAEGSPIIRLATTVRQGGRLEYGTYGESRVIRRDDLDPHMILKASQVLVGLNRTRTAYNRRIRELLGHESPLPVGSDKLVCLKNDREKHLLNGSLWSVVKPGKQTDEAIHLRVLPDDASDGQKPTRVKVRKEFFLGGDTDLDWQEKRGTHEFTYGYSLTVHKSQGSQWPDVVIFDESRSFPDNKTNHLYTAITRASERVTVVM